MKILILSLVTFFLLMYIAIFVYFVITQELHIYLAPNRSNENCEAIKKLTKIEENNTILYHYDNQNSDTLVVFYHGNASIVCDMLFLADIFDENGVSYIFPEFSGYSDRSTQATHSNTLENVRDVVSFIEEADYNTVNVIGQSIGTGHAAYHSQIGKSDKLLLISPFTKLSDIAINSLSFYPSYVVRMFTDDTLDNQKNLSEYKGELVILHGSEDMIIPYSLGEDLFNSVHLAEKKLIPLKGYGHNDIYQSPQTMIVIQNFIQDQKIK